MSQMTTGTAITMMATITNFTVRDVTPPQGLSVDRTPRPIPYQLALLDRSSSVNASVPVLSSRDEAAYCNCVAHSLPTG